MKELTPEQKEVLQDMTSEQWAVISAVAHLVLSNLEQAVLRTDIAQGSRGLVLAKARLDGACSIIKGIEQAKVQLVKEK